MAPYSAVDPPRSRRGRRPVGACWSAPLEMVKNHSPVLFQSSAIYPLPLLGSNHFPDPLKLLDIVDVIEVI